MEAITWWSYRFFFKIIFKMKKEKERKKKGRSNGNYQTQELPLGTLSLLNFEGYQNPHIIRGFFSSLFIHIVNRM